MYIAILNSNNQTGQLRTFYSCTKLLISIHEITNIRVINSSKVNSSNTHIHDEKQRSWYVNLVFDLKYCVLDEQTRTKLSAYLCARERSKRTSQALFIISSYSSYIHVYRSYLCTVGE